MLTWMWVVWLLAGLILLGLEVHTQAFYSLFLAVGSFAATVVALFPTDVWVQAVVGAAVAIVGTMAVRPTLARMSARHLGPKLAMPGASDNLIGQPALTLEAVGDENHPGHARLFNEKLAGSHRESRWRSGTSGSYRRRSARHHPCGRAPQGRLNPVDNSGLVTAIIVIVLLIVVAILIGGAVRVVPQGFAGVVTRFGRFRRESQAGLTIITPFIDKLLRVDMRETPRTGDRQDVITRDNVAVAVNATIFSQVIEPRAALFNVSDYLVAIDQQARTTLRNAFGNVSLDEALSSREQINAAMQQQMEQVTDKWGIRINRIEIVDISPPVQILQAMALQKQADQEKRARILQSEGQQQSAVNIADGNRQAAIKQAEGERQAAILRAEGNRQAAILEAEGRAQAISTVYGSIKAAAPDPTLVAILQLDTLTKFAESPNAKLVVPAETAGLLGAAQVLRSVLGDAPGLEPPTVVTVPPSSS